MSTTFSKFYKELNDIDNFLYSLTTSPKSSLKGSLVTKDVDTYHEISNDGQQYTIYALLPGYKKEQLDISSQLSNTQFEDDYLLVSSKEIDKTTAPSFIKSVKLKLYVSSNKWNYDTIEASLNDGVLKIKFDLKNEKKDSSKIEIKWS